VITCSNCGADNPIRQKFCGECGTALAGICTSCGATNPQGQKFCGECGSSLPGEVPPTPSVAVGASQTTPVDERRLVSVLFADLVGFTSLSEGSDAEEVRELLSRYFESSKRLTSLYGGTVEKFIGDAVMSVWGSPTAQEDDAERAVRAALDLVAMVSALGDEIGAPELRARAGVLTGEAAVTVGAESEGMVIGDLVNTASRIQAAAEPGSVLVGESTKRATEAAIAYSDAGTRELKGKAEPVPLFRALRVTAGRAGTLKGQGLEPPFVGRDPELRLVKQLFHASTEEKKAHLVSVAGIAGIGKTRLSWEFEKYVDGLIEDVWWHRGRCLAYGEGVAYWALAEMVRMRCRILDEEEPVSAREKLRAALAEYIPDAKERQWVEPRVAQLLALEGAAGDEENLFSAWRIFFERLAERSPTVLVFEDMQWADAGLLDFIEYLLDWSRSLPLFVLVLARPEFDERRPSWGAGKRGFTSLYLDPLSPQAMDDLLTGLVPGLPDELRASILERAEGIPLYAVETVRMLLDRGLVARHGEVYRPVGPIETLAVPETLHALIAARLDSLTTAERHLLQDASVLGKVFTIHGLTAVTRLSEAEVEPLLGALVRKEMLSIQADPYSPERGRYSFLQDLVRRVAYETISKRERKAMHLAAAEFLLPLSSSEEDEAIQVVASHYLDAYAAAPDDPDAEAIRSKARETLVRAAERAGSLAANAEAQRGFERAIELTDEPLVEAELHERAGMAAAIGARADDASAHFERSIALFEAEGTAHPAARVSARLAEILWDRGRIEDGLKSMERSLAVLLEEEPDEDVAVLAAQVGRFRLFAGDRELASQGIETALRLAEALSLPEVLSQGLNTKSVLLLFQGRRDEGSVLLRHALEVALEHDKPSAALRAFYNLADGVFCQGDRYEDSAEMVRRGLAEARKVGNRYWEWAFLGFGYPFYALGAWDEVLAMRDELPHEDWTRSRIAYGTVLCSAVPVCVHRGRLDDAKRILEPVAEFEHSADIQERCYYGFAKAQILLSEGDRREALRVAESVFAERESMSVTVDAVKEAFALAVQAALELDRLDKAEELLAIVERLAPGLRPQFLNGQLARFRAQFAARRGKADDADHLFRGACGLFQQLAIPFHLASTRLEYAQWLAAQGRPEEAQPVLAEARETFERLRAKPWLERLGQPSPVGRETEVVTAGSAARSEP
jgi:class 3 adenylate cyclase/tetratricopeptide (TPR) repeat protein/ribosomal protein L40E